MLRIRSSIPLAWRKKLSNNWTNPSQFGLQIGHYDCFSRGGQDWHTQHLSQGHVQGSRAWEEPCKHRLPALVPQPRSFSADWGLLRKGRNNQKHRETKLQTLHFQILNRVVPSNSFLAHIRIKDSDSCSCCEEVDSLVHFFFNYPIVAHFRSIVFAWLLQVEDLRLENITTKYFLFGLPPTMPKSNKINAIFMSMKFYIYRQRLFHEGRLELTQWLRDLRFYSFYSRHYQKIRTMESDLVQAGMTSLPFIRLYYSQRIRTMYYVYLKQMFLLHKNNKTKKTRQPLCQSC